MKAAVLYDFGSALELEDVDIALPTDGEVLIRIVASGVCHSDRTIQMGSQNRPLPMVLGHELAGVVLKVGDGVGHVKPGDHVVTCITAGCGVCEWCSDGAQQHCTNRHDHRAAGQVPRLGRGGKALHALGGLGGFAEEALVSGRAVTRIPDEMPLDRASLLGCAVLTGLGAVRNAVSVRVGDTVAVIGCGGVGLNAIQGARLAGASRIIAIDRLAAKEDLARLFGADDFIDASACDPVAMVREMTGGGVMHAIEVVGSPVTVEHAFRMLRVRGTASVLGVARPDAFASIAPVEFLQEKHIQGVRLGSASPQIEIPLYAQMYLSGRLRLDELLSHRLPLKDINYALDELDNPTGARSVLVME